MRKHYRHDNNCLNCGTILQGNFCHNCGQENLEINESFGHMMNHAVSDYFHFDQQFFQTLKPLLFKPGFLTNEYMAGRRVRYLHPVKMYIFISVVYFLLLFQSGREPVRITQTEKQTAKKESKTGSIDKAIVKNPNIASFTKKRILEKPKPALHSHITIKKVEYNPRGGIAAVNFDADDTTYREYIDKQNQLPEGERDGFFGRLVNQKFLTYKEKYGARAKEVFFDELKHNIPKMMFLLLPLAALILNVTFRKNKKFYVEHLIYTFHLHCFLFLVLAFIMLLQMLLPAKKEIDGLLSFLGFFYMIWYVYSSLKVIYNRSRFRTITKMTGMSLMYFLALIFCIAIVFSVTALMVT